MSTQWLTAHIAEQLDVCVVMSDQLLLAGAPHSYNATHLIAELIELTAIEDILVWINKGYIDILFFVCARNPIKMNFSTICFILVVPSVTYS